MSIKYNLKLYCMEQFACEKMFRSYHQKVREQKISSALNSRNSARFLSLKQLHLQHFFYLKPYHVNFLFFWLSLMSSFFLQIFQNFTFLHLKSKCKLPVKTHIVIVTPCCLLHASFVVNFRATWRLIVELSLVRKRSN